MYCARCREAVNKVITAESVFAARRMHASEGWRRYTWGRTCALEAYAALDEDPPNQKKFRQLNALAKQGPPPRPSRSLGPPVSLDQWRRTRRPVVIHVVVGSSPT
jgi:hypothetical protein